jgi:hypothetical protein
MLVQYNTAGDLVTNIAPYPLKLSRDRVTEENAEVRFSTKSSRFKFPNKITTKDFEGWKQEDCIIRVNMIKPLLLFYLQMIKESPKWCSVNCSLWKGHYIYTGLSLENYLKVLLVHIKFL